MRRPEVTVKFAQTLDGRIATSTGDSRWVSGEKARILGHRLRAEHDAVLVGVGTIVADNPRLTVRLCDGPNPIRVVADSTLRIPLTASVLTLNPASTIIVTTQRAAQERHAAIEALGARVMVVSSLEPRLNLEALLEQLAVQGLRRVLVEGGAEIITSLLRLRLVDQLVAVIAPKVVGAGLQAVGELGIRKMDQALTFTNQSFETVGEDIVFRGSIRWP